MGDLTTFTIWNDALHKFLESPKDFAEALFKGMTEANRSGASASVGFQGYCNYIDVQPSRHADDHTVYVHSGNNVFNINGYCKDMEELIARDPDLAAKLVKQAEDVIKTTKRKIKEAKTAQKPK